MEAEGWQGVQLPGFVRSLERNEEFNFACHKGVRCFTECCRLLELAITPYDILRLRRATGLHSRIFLEKYVIIEREHDEVFPRLYLTMVDDGRGSCPFVSPDGCSVYYHRPGACRVYPLGRAAKQSVSGGIEERFVLVKEEHCRGFEEEASQTAEQYNIDQGMLDYNSFNDALASLLHNSKALQDFTPTKAQQELFLLALFNLDEWRAMLVQGAYPSIDANTAQTMGQSTDEELLLFSVKWLRQSFFG